MTTKRRGRPRIEKKHQMNLRMKDEYKILFNFDMSKGCIWHYLRDKHPAGWYYFDPPENPKKRFHDDYSKKSGRASQTWSNSSIMMALVHDFMNVNISKSPEWFLINYQEGRFDLPRRYFLSAESRYNDLHSECSHPMTTEDVKKCLEK